MEDIILVTSDSVRYDYLDEMENMSSLKTSKATTAAHYTRPSLSALISSSYKSTINTTPSDPSLAKVLQQNGYTTIGMAGGPQTNEKFGFGCGFDYYENYVNVKDNAISNRTSKIREYLGKFNTVRAVYRLYSPMGSVLENIPSSEEIIDDAIEKFNQADSPRFLWVHLMDTHRPYGRGEKGVSDKLDRKSELARPNSKLISGLTTEEREKIISEYRRSLNETDKEIERLRKEVGSDTVFIFTSDHGEEFGEEGYYYHQGYRKRIPNSITEVPLSYKNINFPSKGKISLLDIAPTILGNQGIKKPSSWDGIDLNRDKRSELITIATWDEESNVKIRCQESELLFKNTHPKVSESGENVEIKTEADDEIKEQLRKLGYTGTG